MRAAPRGLICDEVDTELRAEIREAEKRRAADLPVNLDRIQALKERRDQHRRRCHDCMPTTD